MTPYYDRDGIAIYCGDCRVILPSVEADALVTDPPYGISLSSGWSGRHRDCAVVGDDSTDV